MYHFHLQGSSIPRRCCIPQGCMRLRLVVGQYAGVHYECMCTQYNDRIPVGARFSSPVRTASEAHPASYTVGTRPFPEVERTGCDIDHPPPSNAKVKERVELYLYTPSEPFVACYRVNLNLLIMSALRFVVLPTLQ